MVTVSTPTLAGKALSAGKKLAPIFGVYNGWMSAPKQGGGNISGQINWIVERLKGFKIADPLITTQIALANPDAYPIASGAGLAVTGVIIEMVGEAIGIPMVKSLGDIAKSGGISTAANALVASYVYEAVNNPHGGSMGGSGSYAAAGALPTGENAAMGAAPRQSFVMSYDDPERYVR